MYISFVIGPHHVIEPTVTDEMIQHGLNELSLKSILHNPFHIGWTLPVCPTIQFYVDLHNILKKERMPADTIGLIYKTIDDSIVVDGNLQAYHHIVTVLKSNRSPNEKIHHCDGSMLKREDAKLKKCIKNYQDEIDRLKAALADNIDVIKERNKEISCLKKSVLNLENENERLQDELEELKKECNENVQCENEKTQTEVAKVPTLVSHRVYAPNVRQLYYSLLAMHLPVRKIKGVIENVITYLFPDVDVSNLCLPSKSCASYMRKHEIPTINKIHQASELSSSQQWHLNSDGTTLNQKKKCAFIINGIVIGIQDVANGSSEIALDALKQALSRVQEASSCNTLNISRIVSSTSDGASTQMKFNALLEEETGKNIVANKCCMHLGVNLRSSQVKAVMAIEEEIKEEEKTQFHDGIDAMVHEVAKLFGQCGTPEYGYGADVFKTFIEIKVRECIGVEKQYYEDAQGVYLKRQIGNRYYVTSYNAGCIYFLRTAMITFLKEQKLIKLLNLLELSCMKKLENSMLLSNLRLEGLLFDKIYSDLMMLVKSKDLNKTTFEMNIHLSELLHFLELIKDKPRLLLDSELQVFKSECRLYSASYPKTNHRLNKKHIPVRRCLYENNENETTLLKMVSLAATAMASKLRSYKRDHLPEGIYYNPDDTEIHSVLNELQPHNDQAESVFGCNDWINSVLPNMAQSTRSAIVETSMNKTMQWLHSQNEEKIHDIVKTALEQSSKVRHEIEAEKKLLLEKKITERQKIIKKAVKKQEKYYNEIQELKSDPLIMSIDTLNQRVTNITSLSIPQSIKDAEIKSLIKRQVRLRCEVFQQKMAKIFFTEKGKSKTLSKLLQELSNIIVKSPPLSVCRTEEIVESDKQLLRVVFDKPSLLTGVKLKHRFQDDDGHLQWYEGVIMSYKRSSFTIFYEETKEECTFTVNEVREDFSLGDLWIL